MSLCRSVCARFKVRESDRESGVAGAVSAQCTGSEMATLAKKKNKSTKTKVEKSSGSDEEGSHDSDSEATDGTEQSGEASPGDAESSEASEVRRAGKKKQQKKKPEGKGKTRTAGKRINEIMKKVVVLFLFISVEIAAQHLVNPHLFGFRTSTAFTFLR